MDSDYFFNTKDYYRDLANKGKEFYEDFCKYLSHNIDEIEELRQIIDDEKFRVTAGYEYFSEGYIKNPTQNNRIRYIYNELEYRRILIMYAAVNGYEPPKFKKITGIDLQIVKSLAKGEFKNIINSPLDPIVQGSTSNLPFPLGMGIRRNIY
jgi:hypothetical protein